MTDETRPASPPPADARDERLVAALAVPGLDTATRDRLVATALDGADEPGDPLDEPVDGRGDELAARRRSGRITAALGVAAALVIGAVVGTAIVSQPDDPTPTAARAPATTGQGVDPQAAPEAASGDAEQPAATSRPVDLGDLGAVAGIDGLRTAVEQRLAAPAEERANVGIPVQCIDVDPVGLGLERITAYGVGSLDGRSVAVIVGPAPDGSTAAAVIDPDDECRLVERVPLGA